MSTGPIMKVNINTREIITVSRKLVCERQEETLIKIRREQRQRKHGTWKHHKCACERETEEVNLNYPAHHNWKFNARTKGCTFDSLTVMAVLSSRMVALLYT